MLVRFPQLVGYSIQRNSAQLSALRAVGLSQTQACGLITKVPTLLSIIIDGPKAQAQMRYLRQVMGMSVLDTLLCPTFLTYSLLQRIGPRWSFHSLHCLESQPFVLSTKLNPTDIKFAEHMASASLDGECAAHSMTCIQLYEEHRTHWQQGAGRQWDARNGTNGLESNQEDPESESSHKNADPPHQA